MLESEDFVLSQAAEMFGNEGIYAHQPDTIQKEVWAMARTKPKRPGQRSVARNGVTADVLTLDEAAAYLRLPKPDVLRLIEDQGLPARQIRSEWRFLKSAIEQWLSTGPPTTQRRKEAQLALAAKYKDDPDLIGICEEAYRQRGGTTARDS